MTTPSPLQEPSKLRTRLGLAVCLALSSSLPPAVAGDSEGFQPLSKSKNVDG